MHAPRYGRLLCRDSRKCKFSFRNGRLSDVLSDARRRVRERRFSLALSISFPRRLHKRIRVSFTRISSLAEALIYAFYRSSANSATLISGRLSWQCRRPIIDIYCRVDKYRSSIICSDEDPPENSRSRLRHAESRAEKRRRGNRDGRPRDAFLPRYCSIAQGYLDLTAS